MNGRERLSQWAKVKASMGRYRLVWLVILAGVFLLLLPTGGEEGERQESQEESWAFDLAATEARLSQVLSRIEGAGEVSVMLTVQNGPQKRLAEDKDAGEDSTRTETVVLSKGSRRPSPSRRCSPSSRAQFWSALGGTTRRFA